MALFQDDEPINLGDFVDPASILARAQAEQEAEEIKRLQEQEANVLKQMGLTPSMRQKQMMDADSKSGFWKKLGRFVEEGVRGAAQGGSYVPYSERKMQDALRDDTAQRPFLKEQLEAIFKQKNTRQNNKTLLEKEAMRTGVGLDKNNALRDMAAMRKSAANYRTDAQTPLFNAQAAQANSMVPLNQARTGQTNQITENLKKTLGLSGNPALSLMRTNDPTLDSKLWNVESRDLRERARLKPKPAPRAAAKGTTPQDQERLSKFADFLYRNPEAMQHVNNKDFMTVAPAVEAIAGRGNFKNFGKAPAESAIKAQAEGMSAVQSLSSLRELVKSNPDALGPIAGAKSLWPYSESRKIRDNIDLARQRVGKALEGGVLRKEDETKYKRILAGIFDTPDLALNKIEDMMVDVQRDIEIYAQQQQASGRNMPTPPKAPQDPTKPGLTKKKGMADLLKKLEE